MKRHLCGMIVSACLILGISILSISAQDCPTIVQQALDTIQSICKPTTGRNQACYGHIAVEAEPQPDIANFAFEEAGDIVDNHLVELALNERNRAGKNQIRSTTHSGGNMRIAL